MTSERPASSPTAHVTALVLIGLLVAIVVGATVARTEIIAKAPGRVVPASRVQTVQTLVAGRIASIAVASGEAVSEGQPLVLLATTDAEVRLEALRLDAARTARRIAAARAALAAIGRDPARLAQEALSRFDAAIPDAPAESLQREVLGAEMDELRDSLVALDAEEARIDEGIAALEAQADALRAEADLARVTRDRAVTLLDRGTTTQAALDEAEASERALARQVVAAERAVDERAAERATLAIERERLISTARRVQAERLEAAEAERARLAQELRAAEQELGDRVIRAPRAGRVADLAVFTVGGRVEAGEQLMTIVPDGEELIVEAAVSNRDVGFVAVGQRAQIQFDAFPFERYGALDGEIVAVALDAQREDSTGAWVYPVEVRLTDPFVEAAGRRLDVQPGMTATVNAVTGERRYIAFVFEPIIAALAESFTER